MWKLKLEYIPKYFDSILTEIRKNDRSQVTMVFSGKPRESTILLTEQL